MSDTEFHARLAALQKRFETLTPEMELTVRDPEIGLEGYVVVFNTGISLGGPLNGCGKGGTRITPTLNLDEIRMLAKRMALKNAAAGLPLGGAKSGIKAVSDAPDAEKTYRRFVRLCKPVLHENGGVFGGFGFDIGGRAEHPVWACDELQSTRSFTGKPLAMGGTDYDNEGIAGLGVAVAAKTAIEYDGRHMTDTRMAVQGAGAMGAAIIRYFGGEYGGKLAAVSDPRLGGTWHINNKGVSPDLMHALSHGDFDTAKARLGADGHSLDTDLGSILSVACDVLFPAALQDVIHENNMDTLKCAYLVEGANNPTSRAAQRALYARGVTVIPDFIANSGGIIAAFVELTSKVTTEDNIKTRKKIEEAKTMTGDRIAANVNRLMECSRTLKVEPVDAGLYIALSNIFEKKN